jgi:shikimate 5-dehydrogenase
MHPKPSFLVGLIGSGISASRTPSMHEAAADAAGIRYLYKKIDLAELHLGVEALPELLTAARRMGFDGLNVTHPLQAGDPSAAGRAFARRGGAWRREHRGRQEGPNDRP